MSCFGTVKCAMAQRIREISKHGANSHASTFTAAKSETGQHLAKLYNKLSCANANGQPF